MISCILLDDTEVVLDTIRNIYDIKIVKQIKDINIEHKNILSFRKIKECINLTTLICTNCNLKSLSGIERCSRLICLDCSNNMIDSLKDIGECISLEKLSCNMNNF